MIETLPEASRRTKVGLKKLRQAVTAGELPEVDGVYSQMRVLADDVDAWMRSKRKCRSLSIGQKIAVLHYDFDRRRCSILSLYENNEQVRSQENRRGRARPLIAGEHRTRKHMSLREATARYWHEHGHGVKSANGFVWPKLCMLVDGLGADTRLDAITNDAIATYIAQRRQKPGRAGGLEAVDHQRRPQHPAGGAAPCSGPLGLDIGREPNWKAHKLRPDAGRRRYLSADEQDRLSSTCRPISPP